MFALTGDAVLIIDRKKTRPEAHFGAARLLGGYCQLAAAAGE
jgi:hypothetical protein